MARRREQRGALYRASFRHLRCFVRPARTHRYRRGLFGFWLLAVFTRRTCGHRANDYTPSQVSRQGLRVLVKRGQLCIQIPQMRHRALPFENPNGTAWLPRFCGRLSNSPIAYQAPAMSRLSQALIAVAWFLATVGVARDLFGHAVNLGFVGAIAFGLGAACANWRAVGAVPARLVPPLGLAALAFVLPALAHGLSVRAGLSAGRGCLALAWFALVLGLGGKPAKQALVWAAVALLSVNLVLAFSTSFVIHNYSPFERVQHEYAAGWPRFRGLANTPAPAGVWALVSVGLIEASPRRRLRWLARALGLLQACASLSIALLAVPALLTALLPQRRLRWCLVGCAAVLAAAVLYFQPLELSVAGRTLVVSRDLPQYWSGGLGDEFMPHVTLVLPGVSVSGHVTAYGKLAFRGLTCFAEHPFVGVGPGRFREACRVMAMNTFGAWTDQRDSHNQIGALLGELGVVGVALLSAAWAVGRRGYRFDALTSWQRAVWVGLLVCSLGSEDLLTLPVLALLASQLASRTPSSVRERASTV